MNAYSNEIINVVCYISERRVGERFREQKLWKDTT